MQEEYKRCQRSCESPMTQGTNALQRQLQRIVDLCTQCRCVRFTQTPRNLLMSQPEPGFLWKKGLNPQRTEKLNWNGGIETT